MTRREFFMGAAALPQITGIRTPEAASRYAIATPVVVIADCSQCGKSNETTVKDVHWRDKTQKRAVAIACRWCRNLFVAWSN
jgi:hypothetical protein